ncbi:Origin recognition complex subunit 2 [Sorochytrium milnesiophthora]
MPTTRSAAASPTPPPKRLATIRLDDALLSKKTKGSTRPTRLRPDDLVSLDDTEDADDSPVRRKQSSALGRGLFGFQVQGSTTKSRANMMAAASSTNTRTPSPSARSRGATPDTVKRMRSKRRLQQTRDRGASDMDGESSEDDDKGDHDDRGGNGVDDDDRGDAEDGELRAATRYFQDQTARLITSSNTLYNLPTLDHALYADTLRKIVPRHLSETRRLQELHAGSFAQWRFELLQGFNLLFYGYGSKQALLERFATDFAADAYPLATVNGNYPSLTIKHILSSITANVLGISSPPGSLSDHLDVILSAFTGVDRLCLLVHNIDGPGLRSDKAQTALSLLAQHPNIHVIASADHINCALLWDGIKAARYHWAWHDVTTFEAYSAETSLENSVMVARSDVTARSAILVLSSLPDSSRQCFKILAEHQLAHLKATTKKRTAAASQQSSISLSASGLSYAAYYAKCREAFVVGHESNFKTILTEFKDHKVVVTATGTQTKGRKGGGDGGKGSDLYIPLDRASLEAVLESLL